MRFSKYAFYPEENLLNKLNEIVKTQSDCEWGKEDKDFCSRFSLSSVQGKWLYKSLSDEALLNHLKEVAAHLGHPPSQREVFWIWREYIKVRFKKWPYALVLAGLPKGAGSGGVSLEKAKQLQDRRNQIVEIIRKKAIELARLPHPSDLTELHQEIIRSKCSWQEMILAAGLDQQFFEKSTLFVIGDLEEEYQQMLNQINDTAKEIGRAPRRHEIDEEIKTKLVGRCGTWRNALYQIGLEPVRSIQPFSATGHIKKKVYHKKSLHDCYYRVLNLNEQDMQDLLVLQDIKEKLGRVPEKNEVPKVLRSRLQEKCGSWANTIYQLQYMAL